MNTTAQRGMALLVVMLITATLATVAAGISAGWTAQASRTRAVVSSHEAYWLMAGAEAIIVSELSKQQKIIPVRGVINADGTSVHYVIRDAANCFNINSLLAAGQLKDDGSYYRPYARRVFIELLINAGLSETNALATLNRLLLTVKAQPDAPTTRSFSHVSALFPVSGLNAVQQNELKKLLCIAPDMRINVNVNTLSSAQAPLLSALFTGSLSVSDARRILSGRPESGWDNPQALSELVGPDAKQRVNDVATAAVTTLQEAELLLWMKHDELHLLRTRLTKKDSGHEVRDRQTLLSEENIDAINENLK